MSIDWSGPSRQICPECGRGPKDRTCGVKLDERGGVAHCHRCGHTETMRGETVKGVVQIRRPEQPKSETLSDYWRKVWSECMPLAGAAVSYLEARKCIVPPRECDLRWHPALPHVPSGTKWPALVALVTDVMTGAPLTLHRTWVQANGEKAPIEPARMLLRGHRKQGGVVRLWPDEYVTSSLGVAEGIESALSVARTFQPVWSAIDAGNLGALPVLRGVDTLLIAADHDHAGLVAAKSCRDRWRGAGVDVRIAVPPIRGSDFNDVAKSEA